MPSIDLWAGSSFPLGAWTDDVSKSQDFARLINDDSTSITIVRNGSPLSAQTVRIETFASGERTVTLNGVTHGVGAIVFGFNGHASITDTDIQPGDRFPHGSARFEVIAILADLENVIQAFCEAKR